MFYTCIGERHEKLKIEPLRHIIYSDQHRFNGYVVIGAEYLADVIDIEQIAALKSKPCILIDIRKDQLDKFPSRAIKFLCDISTIEGNQKVIDLIKSNYITKPFIYDNTNGGPKRQIFIKQYLDVFDELTFFAHLRHGSITKLHQNFKVIKQSRISNKNALLTLTKKEVYHVDDQF